MKPNLRIDTEDLQTLFVHTRESYGNIDFEDWSKECAKSYINYFNNKEMYNKRKYTYSQFVNAQIIAITQPF